MAHRSRRMFYLIPILLLSLLFASNYFLNKQARTITNPQRRPLQDYHLNRLQDPAKYGLVIEKVAACDGQIPALLVHSTGQPSERGLLLRKQMLEAGATPCPLADLQQPKATLVLLHGRHGRKEDLLSIAERFCAVGFRCLLPDLPAHGESPLPICHFSGGDAEKTLIIDSYKELAARHHFSSDPVALWGMSMGGAYLTRAAHEDGALWSSLCIICSFPSLQEVMDEQVGTFVAGQVSKKVVSLGGTHPKQINSAQLAKSINAPLLMLHGENDELIPLAQGQAFFEAFASDHKEFIAVKDAGHSNILTTPEPLYLKMALFFLTHTDTKKPRE